MRMTKIVDPWQPPLGGKDGTLLEEEPQIALQAPDTVSSPTFSAVPDKWRIRGKRKFPTGPGAQIMLDLPGDIIVERKQA